MFNWDLVKSNDWRLDRKRLSELKREIEVMDAEVPVMSAYLHRRLDEKIAQMAPGIKAGAIGEFKQAIAAYQKSIERMDAAGRKEAASWDIARLASEKAAIRSMIDEIGKSNSPFEKQDKLERLQGLYSEMMAGDTVRKRAAVEVFGDITEYGIQGQTKGGDEIRYRLGGLARAARAAEPELRVSSEMLAADTEIQQARAALAEKHAELVAIGQELNDDLNSPFATGDLSKAFKLVKWGPDGSVKAILPEDSPELPANYTAETVFGGGK